MSAIIAKQMIRSHIRDIVLSKTVDPYRFVRMIRKAPIEDASTQLGSFDQRIAGVKKLIERLDDTHVEYRTVVLDFIKYVEQGNPLWSEIKLA